MLAPAQGVQGLFEVRLQRFDLFVASKPEIGIET